uniref:3CxxC-type domain-containing protein n=1 Tax=Knipowitschia caucasica TaxID=637954 RepID=A0AAV2KV35_KNICA
MVDASTTLCKFIEENNQDCGWKEYIRRTCARFKCRLCKRTWPSNKVMVIFHMHLNNHTHQGIIKVRCFRQNCKICTDAPMEQPHIDEDNVLIMLEGLMKNIRKKFYKEVFEEMDKKPQGVEVKSPHEPDHCEGCRAGICSQGQSMP